MWYDFLLAFLGVAVIVYMLIDFEAFIYRSVIPTFWDKFFGIILILLVLEATRRTTGSIMPAIVIAFLIYALTVIPIALAEIAGLDLDDFMVEVIVWIVMMALITIIALLLYRGFW